MLPEDIESMSMLILIVENWYSDEVLMQVIRSVVARESDWKMPKKQSRI